MVKGRVPIQKCKKPQHVLLASAVKFLSLAEINNGLKVRGICQSFKERVKRSAVYATPNFLVCEGNPSGIESLKEIETHLGITFVAQCNHFNRAGIELEPGALWQVVKCKTIKS